MLLGVKGSNRTTLVAAADAAQDVDEREKGAVRLSAFIVRRVSAMIWLDMLFPIDEFSSPMPDLMFSMIAYVEF